MGDDSTVQNMAGTLAVRRRISIRLAMAAAIAVAPPAAANEALKPSDGAKRAKIWEKDIAAFEKQDAEHPTQPGMVLFVGSSSILLWDLQKWFPDLRTLNRGFGGSHISDSAHFVGTLVVKHDPAAIVIYAGDNDLAAGLSPEQVHRDFQQFVSVVREDLPQTPIVYIAVKASLARWTLAERIKQANQLIAAQCAEDDSLTFADVWAPMLDDHGQPRPELLVEDGLHMTDAGYRIWVDLLTPTLQELLKKQPSLDGGQ